MFKRQPGSAASRSWPAAPVSRAILALASALALAGGRAAAQTAPAPTDVPASGSAALTYRLAADWHDVPYSGALARVRRPVDISSGGDGTVFVLESATQYTPPGGAYVQLPAVVHVIAPDDTLQRVIELTEWLTNAYHLDATLDGQVVVQGEPRLGTGARSRTLVLDADGRHVGHWDYSVGYVRDVASLPDGRIAVAADGDIVVIDPADSTLRRESVSDLGIDAPELAYTYLIVCLDAANDGRITALVSAYRTCPSATSNIPRPSPLPTATPRPSHDGPNLWSARPASPADAAQSGAMCNKDFAITLNPSLALDAVLPVTQHHDDLAVRDGEVYATYRRRPGFGLQVRPLGGHGPAVDYPMAPVLPGGLERPFGDIGGPAIDVAPDGAILAVWTSWDPSGDPFHRGPVRLGIPGQPQSQPIGMAYRNIPAIEGPILPRAITAGDDGLFVLDGGHMRAVVDGSAARIVDVVGAANAAQRWTLDGRLLGQWAHGRWDRGRSDPVPDVDPYGVPEDVSASGERLYTATPGGIWLRTSAIEPVWFSGVDGVRLAAVDADSAAVAALDIDGSQVIVWTPDGRQTAAWPIALGGRPLAASDIAIGGGRVYVADRGQSQVLVRSLTGDDLGGWRTMDGPQRLDVAPGGDVVVLGWGGWGMRYAPGGELRAAWRMPGAFDAGQAEGTDITAGPDGRVYVTYSRVVMGSAVKRSPDRIAAAGIWAFESATPAHGDPPPPARHPCSVDIDKSAAPGRIALGEAVTVTLTVGGACPKVPVPQQIVLVVDTSWSMDDGYHVPTQPPGALERARRILSPLLATLDPSIVDVGLVTFGSGAALQSPLSDDLADVRTRILRAKADGDTLMGAGVAVAHDELNSSRRDPGARRSILIVSDGVFKDDPRQAVAAARADDIDVHGLIVTTFEFSAAVHDALLDLVGADHLHLDPSPERTRSVIDALSAWRSEAGLFETVTVQDVVPANMRYVLGSAVPPADWDAATRTLTWTLAAQPAGAPLTLAFAVVPLEPGTWPTNVVADVTWRDVRGGTGTRRFPVPEVVVDLIRPVYLPFAARTVCAQRRRPLDLVLVHDVSSSMGEPAADGVRTKLEVAVEAAGQFVAGLEAGHDRVAIVAFDAEARVAAPLSSDRAAASTALAALRPGFGTRIDRGLRAAIDVVLGDMRGQALPVVVLLSDGLQSGPPDPVHALLPELRALGARVVVIGYGAQADDALLREIAGPEGDHHFAPAVEDLQAVYEGVGRLLVCP